MSQRNGSAGTLPLSWFSAGLLLALIVGLVLGKSGSSLLGSLSSPSDYCDEEYSILNPYLWCEDPANLQKQEFILLKERLEKYIKGKVDSDQVEQVAVYFRDLENGPGFSIHEDALFSPASMLKLPMLISILKESEHNPSLLSQQITLAEIPDIDSPAVFPAPPLEVHRPYTVEELLRAMIIHSDNVSLFVLGALLQQLYPTEDLLADTLTEMGIAKSEQTVEDFLTVKRYSSFYRALYNASFLSKEKSQAALNMLSATTFKEGIMAGLPQGTVVAHKFGERDGKQLHDCGIVYHPRTPYLLCIMTKGSSIPALLDIIRTLSHDVYAEVDSRP